MQQYSRTRLALFSFGCFDCYCSSDTTDVRSMLSTDTGEFALSYFFIHFRKLVKWYQ